MYLEHFGLTELPFGITPDTGFIFATASHQAALNTLLVALAGGEGFIKITGEVGTGKTLLCRRFLKALPGEWVSAYLPNPYLGPRALMLALAEELGLALDAAADEYHLLQGLNGALLERAGEGKGVVLCIDEAQAMPLETLESLRLLSNLETEKRKLLHIVLFGQPELDARLAQPAVRQLRQRIAFHHRLEGLGRQEMARYLSHRLQVAGCRHEGLFSPQAASSLHWRSGGIPRLANILAHKSLLAAFGEGGRTVKRSHVRRAAADTEGARRLLWW